MEDLLEDLLGCLELQESGVDRNLGLMGSGLSLAWPSNHVQASRVVWLFCAFG